MHLVYFLLIHVIKFNLLTIFMFINVNLHLNTFPSSVYFVLASVKYFTCSCLKFNELSISHSSLVYLVYLLMLELSLFRFLCSFSLRIKCKRCVAKLS